jgi:excisionase family DNA binding protein
MATMFYSTGQAARELNITQDRVRQLCEAGAVTAEITAGGQWRVPKAEIDRLRLPTDEFHGKVRLPPEAGIGLR